MTNVIQAAHRFEMRQLENNCGIHNEAIRALEEGIENKASQLGLKWYSHESYTGMQMRIEKYCMTVEDVAKLSQISPSQLYARAKMMDNSEEYVEHCLHLAVNRQTMPWDVFLY